MSRFWLRACTALAFTPAFLPWAAAAQQQPQAAAPVLVLQPRARGDAAQYIRGIESRPAMTEGQMVALLRQKVKYVFVLFQENRSFDSYYGSFPGARNLFSQPPEQTPGYTQPLLNTDGTYTTVSPFRIGPQQYAADTDDVDHSQARMAAKMDINNGVASMDRFALVEEMKYTPAGANPPLAAKQYGELTMAYEDCDTIPFLWNYASRFVLFDNIFQTTIGPSTPNAISMIAGQSGLTQWVKHPETAYNSAGIGEPVIGDADPFWGSPKGDTASGQPQNPRDSATATPQINQTYATLMLTMPGASLSGMVGADRAPQTDLADVQNDVAAVASLARAPYPWGWYEEGYDREPTDPSGTPPGGTHASYVGHHNGPQYFGYIANNPQMSTSLHGLDDFFRDIGGGTLPGEGGVFFVRGGFRNIAGLAPADPDANVQANFQGDDDHPGYSDSELSEALVAREVNAIARSPYWPQSAIIITYDESEGDYDHVPPRILNYGPDGTPVRRGPRIPLTLISPYSRVHAVSHESGDHNAVIRFINAVFNLPPLADLPDELQAQVSGQQALKQQYLGPEDDGLDDIGNLLSAFDPARLTGNAPALPAQYATIPDEAVNTLPHYGAQGCRAINVVPEDVARGIRTTIPADFNPRPTTDPTETAGGQ